MSDIPKLSFFITRKVRNIDDNFIWIECIKQLRNFYKYEPIFIIDDCNDINLITDLKDIQDFPTFNIHILNTDEDLEIKGKGYVAGYYYYRKMKVSKRAIFLHDSIFLLKPFDDNLIYNSDIRFLFGFIDNNELFKSIVNNIIYELNEGDKIIEYKYKFNWVGCFGNCSLISLDYLLYLEKRYNFFIILKDIKSKIMNEVFERLFGLLITYDKENFNNLSFYGLKGLYNYDLNNYKEKKEELIANDIPYFNYHQHQI